MLWFSLLVLIPLSAVVVEASGGGWGTYRSALTNGQTLNALQLTVGVAFLTTVINMVMGTVIAWVLVRDRFWGKRALDLIIDIPFAMPTIVAGLVLLALYGSQGPIGVELENTRKAVFLAIAFVTLPFIVRTVQPVMEEMETEVEDAAASLGATPAQLVGTPYMASGHMEDNVKFLTELTLMLESCGQLQCFPRRLFRRRHAFGHEVLVSCAGSIFVQCPRSGELVGLAANRIVGTLR